VDGTGAATPTGYRISLSGTAALRHVVRRIDPGTLAPVPAPPAPAGTRTVVLFRPGQSPGDFATIRNLVVNGNVGLVTVPPGTYGTFVVNGGSGMVLGVAGATEPAVYNLQGLALGGGATLHIAGPVVLNLAHGAVLGGDVVSTPTAGRFTINVASGGLTFNGTAPARVFVNAPDSLVILNAPVVGAVTAERLVIGEKGRLSGID
jgi:hypothetical protein